MGVQHGGHQPDEKHHGGNRPGEDRPHGKPRTRSRDGRPDVNRPDANEPGGKAPKPGADPEKPGGRY